MTPWLSKETRQIPDLWLAFHSEIVEFGKYIQPNDQERTSRSECFDLLKSIFEEAIPGSLVNKFGSYATALNLKNADIDLVLAHPSHSDKKLMRLAYSVIMEKEAYFDSVEVIKTAKVPLIKFRVISPNCEIDMCFNETGGVSDLNFVGRAVVDHPEIKPIYLVLKLFFRQRKMNNSYSGGIGSFLLFTLVYNFVLGEKEKRGVASGRPGMRDTLGYYLVGFLRHYSAEFDFRNSQIDFNKTPRETKKESQGLGLSVIPPGKSENIAQSCWRFPEITKILRNRHQFLQEAVLAPGESILKHLVNPTGDDFSVFEAH